MRNTKLISTTWIAACLLASQAAASTWVVDDDGGPGVDFTSVSAAIAAASSGDRIWIHPGNYSGNVSTDKPLTLMGLAPGVHLLATYTWHDLPLNGELRVIDLSFSRLFLQDCDSAVLLDKVSTNGSQVSVNGCRDVRAQGCSFLYGTVVAEDCRLELVDCFIRGNSGYDGGFVSGGGPGWDALQVRVGAVVSVHASTIIGGSGGSTLSTMGDYGGDGGAGARIDAGGHLTVAGTSGDWIVGGQGGLAPNFGAGGFGGNGADNSGSLRISGAQLLGGVSPDYIDGVPIVGNGVFEQPDPGDPFMRLEGVPSAGQPLRIVIHGEPGGVVRLLAGRKPILSPFPNSFDLRLTQPFRSMWVGNLPASGFLEHDIVLPPTLNTGSRFVLQAKITTPAGDRLTNSTPLLVR